MCFWHTSLASLWNSWCLGMIQISQNMIFYFLYMLFGNKQLVLLSCLRWSFEHHCEFFTCMLFVTKYWFLVSFLTHLIIILSVFDSHCWCKKLNFVETWEWVKLASKKTICLFFICVVWKPNTKFKKLLFVKLCTPWCQQNVWNLHCYSLKS